MEKTGQNTSMNNGISIKTLKITDIEEAFYNPRKTLIRSSKKYQNLQYSIERFGIVEPLVVNDFNNRLISGHQRLNVIRDLGKVNEVECTIVHIENMAEEKALNVALNKIEGSFDKKKLADIIQNLDEEFVALDLGFEEGDIAAFLKNDQTADEVTSESTIDAEHADNMDDGINLKKEAANVVCQIGGVRFTLTALEMSSIETGLIEQGYFSEKDMADAMTKRLLCEI